MEQANTTCHVCGKRFTPRFSFQREQQGDRTIWFCSQACKLAGITAAATVTCATCGTTFSPDRALQVADSLDGRRYYCSLTCRQGASAMRPTDRPQRRLAVINQKGGTGKTTTAINVAASLAQRGLRTLLVDLDPQGSVGVSLGINGSQSAYNLFVNGHQAEQCTVPIRDNLDIITADESLAQAEIYLARSVDNRRLKVLDRVLQSLRAYDYVIVDCAPALSLLNQNALLYAKEVLVPVSCDYLSLVGVHQVQRTVEQAARRSDCPIRISAILPTFYDVRNKISSDALSYLRRTFGVAVLPPIRINVKLQEAPRYRRTIFEHAPDSNGARDYVRVVEWLINSTTTESTDTGVENSESFSEKHRSERLGDSVQVAQV